MDHPITIVATYQDTAISMMQSHNNPQVYGTWTSPMLANRQLKYFFSEMQTQQYNKSLNRLHQILRKAGDKNKLWMSSFVLMLGIALVLEQCQHLLWIKADAKVARRESSSIDAEWEARSHCNEMDDGFEFLCKLYHCKYRGKHRQKTRYEELKNKTSNAAEAEFAEKIYDIVDRNGEFVDLSLTRNEHSANFPSRRRILVASSTVDDLWYAGEQPCFEIGCQVFGRADGTDSILALNRGGELEGMT